ncbi:hypothetical protein [Pseudoalteromonas sp. SG44-17]|uniref:hypothetical protein n=1 Tax=Pseudoalteromonas sp. SG44-17 TaxID=2760963 RepID=UPI001601C71F|nr:hypothetical protein [Pseudoalteromonas sp. SG44-17]MBB1410184.1 hypothetical protein [Pseudoalteromonas sp. SG44-17]
MMDHLTSSIALSLETRNWHAALATALTIPDICSYINDGAHTNGKKYAAWFNQYVGSFYKTNYSESQLQMVLKYSTKEDYENLKKQTKLSGNDCYAFRCAYLHQGLGDISSQRAREILQGIKFVEPHGQMIMHGSILNNQLILHINTFCEHMIAGVEQWRENLDTEQSNRFNNFLLVKDVFDVAGGR